MVLEPIKTTLVHKILPSSAPQAEQQPALILLHGRGTDEDDLLGLAGYLDPRFFIVSARAPFPFPNGGFAWYQILEVGTPDPQQFDESYRRLSQFVEDVKVKYPVDPGSVFLLGFSMGSIMSLALSLTKPGAFKGVIAHSGYIPENTSLRFRWQELAGLGLFVAHGTEDPVIPIEFGRRARELLSKTRADFVYREYPIGHTISEESLSDFSAWLRKKLDVPGDMK
jgi:phospholipase/carboxylesterase